MKLPLKKGMFVLLFTVNILFQPHQLFAKAPPPNTKKMDYQTCTTSGCHSSIKQKKFLHGPVQVDGCYLCHIPVMGKHEFRLYRDLQKMCTDCHDELTRKNIKKIHGAHETTILKTDTQEFSTHHFDLKLTKQEKTDLISSGVKFYKGQLTCLSCHNPHQSDHEHLQRDIKASGGEAALCFKCHEKKFKQGSHKMPERMCFDCHGFHKGVMATPLYREPGKKELFCLNCHEEKQAIIKTKHDYTTWSQERKDQTSPLLETKFPPSTRCHLCHKMHNPATEGMLLVKTQTAERGHKIVQFCLTCHNNSNVSAIKQIKEPLQHVPIPFSSVPDNEGQEISLEFFLASAKRAEEQESEFLLTCATCHDPHTWSKNHSISLETEGTPDSSFLRESGKITKFCSVCHGPQALTLYTRFHSYEPKKNDQPAH